MEQPVSFSDSDSAQSPELVTLVDFKWLMAADGHRIDLDRLRQDRAYARGCLALAAGSTRAELRQSAMRLGREMQLVAPRL